MSRRARRRSGRAGSSWAGRAGLGALVILVLGTLVVLLGIRSYLHGESFRRMLSREAGKALQGEAEFAAFRWKGLQVNTDSFTSEGEAMLSRLRADGVTTEIGLGGFGRGVWEVRGTHVRKLEAAMDLTKRVDDGDAKAKPAAGTKARRDGWLPTSAELMDLEISNIALDAVTGSGPASLSGMRLKAESAGAPMSYRAVLDGGVIRLPVGWLPPLELKEARVRWQDDALFLTSLEAAAWDTARLTATGEWDKTAKRAALEGAVNNIPSAQLLTGDWVKRVSGTIDIGFTGEMEGGIYQARGDLRITDGVLTALPVLDVLAAYADTRRFRVLQLQQADCRWNWRDGAWRFSDIVLHSEGLARLEGGFTLRGREIDGSFRLGLAPGTLANIPGAETDVFLPGEHGLLWTTLRVTGTLDDPKEDLSERLIAAAGMRMFEMLPETGEQVIRHSKTLAREVAPKALEQGIRILDKGQGIVNEATGILDGLLGKPTPPVVPEPSPD